MTAVLECLAGLAFAFCMLTAIGCACCVFLTFYAVAVVAGIVDRLWRGLVRLCR